MKALLFIIFIIILIPTVQAIDQFENPGFETGDLSNWTVVDWGDAGTNGNINTDADHSGTYGLQTAAWSYTPGTNGRKFYQNLSLTGVGKVNFYYKIIDLDNGIEFFGVFIDNVEKWNTTEPIGGWISKEVDISGYSGYHDVEFMIWVDGVGPPTPLIELYLDDVSLEVGEYTLSGYVKNNYGNTISSANINLNASGGSTTSNDTGYYELTGLEYGTYSITATSPTNEDYSDTISINTNTEKNITMTRLTPALSNAGIIDSSENTLRIGWKENAVVDSVRIYQGTNTNLIATEDTSYISLASYTVGNLDADTGYNFWLEPWDGAVSGIKYYVSGTTDGDGGGGGGGGPISDPTPRPTTTPRPTPAPTSPPWTNITDEDWLNLTRYEQEYILFEHDKLNITIGTYTPKPVNLSFWYLILFLGICSTAYGSQKKNGELLFTCGLVAVVISMIKLGLF